MSREDFTLVAVKRWWVPEWLFAICTGWYRLFDLDIADWPWMRAFLTTEDFHYHGSSLVYGRKDRCRACQLVRKDLTK